jgi:hypothetical protein
MKGNQILHTRSSVRQFFGVLPVKLVEMPGQAISVAIAGKGRRCDGLVSSEKRRNFSDFFEYGI